MDTKEHRPGNVRRVLVGPREIITEGIGRAVFHDLFHHFMTVSWPQLFATFAGFFLVFDTLFGFLYFLAPGCIANLNPPGFAGAFFFSVETLATVGYGDMHPQTIYGHIVATAENFTGLLLLAVMTGLVFARFSRPRARIIFAKYPVVTKHNGAPTLIFRMANARSNFITEATAKLWVLRPTVTEEGKRLIGFEGMRLLRSENPTFALSWTLFHPIDEQSPLIGQDEDTLTGSQMNFVVSVVGFDDASGQIVRARDVFAAQDLRFGQEYVDFVWIDEQGMRHIDYAKIDAIRPVSPGGGSVDEEPSPNPDLEPVAGASQATEDERR